eukprot:2489614-Prymnesium_polylepis.1
MAAGAVQRRKSSATGCDAPPRPVGVLQCAFGARPREMAADCVRPRRSRATAREGWCAMAARSAGAYRWCAQVALVLAAAH